MVPDSGCKTFCFQCRYIFHYPAAVFYGSTEFIISDLEVASAGYRIITAFICMCADKIRLVSLCESGIIIKLRQVYFIFTPQAGVKSLEIPWLNIKNKIGL